MLKVEDNRERRKQLENYLARGRGSCWLRRPDVASMVDGAIRFYHEKLYDLLAWVVMPNHVHLLLVQHVSMRLIIGNLKTYTARQANGMIEHRGQFWAEDYFDTCIRDDRHELRARRYIENNPVKAGLIAERKLWPFSSARFRNAYERLVIGPAAVR